MHFLDILVVFRLDIENVFATRQLAPLATSITFYNILAHACAEIKILRFCMSLGFPIFDIFFHLSFFSFSFPFAAVFDLLLGLLAVKTTSGNFYCGAARCSGRKFHSEFFTQLFQHFCAYLKLQLADHCDLGIIRKIISSCRS